MIKKILIFFLLINAVIYSEATYDSTFKVREIHIKGPDNHPYVEVRFTPDLYPHDSITGGDTIFLPVFDLKVSKGEQLLANLINAQANDYDVTLTMKKNYFMGGHGTVLPLRRYVIDRVIVHFSN